MKVTKLSLFDARFLKTCFKSSKILSPRLSTKVCVKCDGNSFLVLYCCWHNFTYKEKNEPVVCLIKKNKQNYSLRV